MKRGEIWWADLPRPVGSEPGYRRPILIIQSDDFNRSSIRTVVAATLSSNLNLQRAPGNVFLSANESGLPKDSVVNVSQMVTIDRMDLAEKCGEIDELTMLAVDDGIRLVLAL
ncbi:MAG: type II toxin-antitoxin system PemK/MazF family toxin [Planctomycetota bacterium]|nr:type II toxin-antitoxin system PemK/MazF family toxin [Planctomycetota bacterium]MDA1214193.1 type II toxin-antitoxin system PemK/MazF family toxin [Planctomycetota bacterium]